MRKRILYIYGIALALGGLYIAWLAVTGIAIPCVFREITGFLCPGCGMTRMCLNVLRGEVIGAFYHNPVAFMLLAVWNLVALLCFIGKPDFVRDKRFLYTMLGVSVAVFAAWGIMRNMIL